MSQLGHLRGQLLLPPPQPRRLRVQLRLGLQAPPQLGHFGVQSVAGRRSGPRRLAQPLLALLGGPSLPLQRGDLRGQLLLALLLLLDGPGQGSLGAPHAALRAAALHVGRGGFRRLPQRSWGGVALLVAAARRRRPRVRLLTRAWRCRGRGRRLGDLPPSHVLQALGFQHPGPAVRQQDLPFASGLVEAGADPERSVELGGAALSVVDHPNPAAWF
mmetsp:Transcript_12337/g.34604  ORF Transcript_12337/g.34604 Transcript_12337/m.34604 type:complete len:216 (+) Transcript_12337:1095-1742(+)